MQSGRFVSSISAILLCFCLATVALAQVTDEGTTGEAGNKTAVNPDIVGAGGEFTHRIPILIPEFRDLPLPVALGYNSSDISRVGVGRTVGFGWSLNAFSSIERKSLGGGVPTFDDGQDLYLLDGQELMACAGAGATNPWPLYYPMRYITDRTNASCSTGGNLTARVEDFNRIVFDGTANSFTVTRPDGVRMIYASLGILAGDASAAGSEARNYATKSRWLLTRIEDTQAIPNVVNYTYAFGTAAQGYAHTLTQIDFAGYNVRFDYRTFSANAVARFATGTSVTGIQDKQLRSIRVYDGTSPIRAYSLTHAASALSGTQLLTAVQQYGADFILTGSDITGGSALPAVAFSYSADTASFFKATAQNTPGLVGKEFHQNSTVIDLDRDGADELLLRSVPLYRKVLSGPASDRNITYSVYYTYTAGHYKFDRLRQVTAFTTPGFLDCVSYPLGEQGGVPNTVLGGPYVLSSDRTGTDYCVYRLAGYYETGGSGPTGGNPHYPITIQTRKLDASGALVDSFGTEGVGHALGNFDLDSSTELRFPWSIAQIENGDIGAFVSAQYLAPLVSPTAPSVSAPVRTLDFTGDGVDDFISNTFRRSLPEPGQFSGGFRGIGYTGSLSISSTVLNAWNAYHPPGSFSTMPGDLLGYSDMNGDGLTDVVYHHHNGSANDSIVYFPSTGVGFGLGITVALPGNFLSSTRGISYFSGTTTQPRRGGHNSALTDINADGITDLVIHDGFSDRSLFPMTAPYLSGGTWVLLGTGSGFVQVPVEGSLAGFNGLVAVGDFDGDGLSDIALEGTNVSSSTSYAISPGSVLFGNGGIPNRLTSITVQTGGVTTVGYAPSSEFGTNQMPGVQQVVKTITNSDGRGGSSTVEFRYVGGRYDFVARQTLGYTTVTATLPPAAGETAGSQVVTTYLNDHIAEYGHVKSRIVTQAGVTLSREIFDYNTIKTGNGPWLIDRIGERSATLFGTDLVETASQKEWNSFGQIVRETSLGFTTNGANLDFSDDVTVTFGFNPNLVQYITDRPKFRRAEAGLIATPALTDDLSYTVFTYDAAADPTTATPSLGNLTRLEEWTGNTAALTLRVARTLSYDAWGNLLTEADAKGQTTTHTYDSAKHLFRLTTANAVGHIASTTWNTLCQTPATVTDPNARVTSKTNDAFCREIRTDLPGGQYLITRHVTFGTPGQQYVERETKSGSTTPGSTLSISREYFDGFGRTWLTASPGSTSSITDAVITLSAFDARGNLAWASVPLPWSAAATVPSPAERISYTYDGLDRQLTTLDADGSKTATEYLTQSFDHFGGAALSYPSTRQLDAHCFDATGAATLCGELFSSLDAAGRTIRTSRLDAGLTDTDASGISLRATSYRFDRQGNLIAVTDPGGISFAYTYDIFGNRLSADDPGLGYWTLTYDANNNLLTQTDAKGQLISFAYDAINRVTLKTVGTGTTRVETRFTYDQVRPNRYNIGMETTQVVWTPAGTRHTVQRDWHLMGGLLFERHYIDGRTYQLETSFAPNGAPLNQRLPGTPGATSTGWVGPFTFDAAGRIAAFTGYITSVNYNAWGQPSAATYANGVTEAYAYDSARGWLTSVTATLPGGDQAFRAAYDRSATGRIFRTDTQGMVAGQPTDKSGAYDYAYDYSGRLLSATNWRGVAAFDQVFAYDRAGRIRAKGASLATATSYAYGGVMTPDHAPTSVTAGTVTTPFTYDANGNMFTGLAGKIMTYDGENRPLSVTYLNKRTCYVYGVDGKRLKKVEGLPPAQDCTTIPATAPATVYFGAVEVRNWKVAGAEQVLTYPHPAVKLLNGTTPATATYLHRDGLSSVRAITSTAGVKIESALYKPFGEQSEWLLPGNAAPETKGWIGERFDADAGLQYLNARYYDPELSLFLQPDWFEVTKAGVGTNRFSYSFNDPVNKMDPGGNNSNVVSGSEGDDDHNVPDHFLKNGLERAKELKDKDEDTTWYIHAGQSGSEFSDLIGGYKSAAEEYGISVKVFRTKDELIDGLTGNQANPIDNLSYVGHGFAGFLGVDARLRPGSGGTYDVDIRLRGSDFAAMHFSSTARVNLYATCNAATPPNGKSSVVEQFSRILSPSASVGGYAAQVNFFDAEVDTDRQLGMTVENPWYWSAYRTDAIKPYVDMGGLHRRDY